MGSLGNKIMSNLIFSSAGNFLIKFFSAIGYFFIVSRLSLYDYGLFVFCTSLLGPVASIVNFGFDRIFVSSFAKARGQNNTGDMKGLVQGYYVTMVFLLILTFILSYFCKFFIAAHYHNDLVITYFWPIWMFIFAQLCFNAVSLFLESNEQFKVISAMQVIESLSRLFMVLFFLGHMSVIVVLGLYTSAKFVATLVGLPFFLKRLFGLFRQRVSAHRAAFWNILKTFGKWELARNVLQQFAAPFEIFIIKHFVSFQGVAIYDFTINLYSACMSLLPLQVIIFPIISRLIAERDRVQMIITKAQKYLFLVYVVVYSGILLVIPFILQKFFPQYAGHTLFLAVTLLHIFIQVYKTGQGALLYALHEQKFLLKIFPFTYALEIFLHILFTYYWGILGTVIAWNLQSLIVTVYINYYLQKKSGLNLWSWESFFHYDEYDKMLLQKIFFAFRSKFNLFRLKQSDK